MFNLQTRKGRVILNINFGLQEKDVVSHTFHMIMCKTLCNYLAGHRYKYVFEIVISWDLVLKTSVLASISKLASIYPFPFTDMPIILCYNKVWN